MEFLEANIEWLVNSLDLLCKKSKDTYLLFDFPGQIELYTHHNSGKTIRIFTFNSKSIS